MSPGVEKLQKFCAELSLMSIDNIGKAEEAWNDNLCKLPEHMRKLTLVDELIAHSLTTVGTGASLTKLGACVERVAETAELPANISKSVAGVSAISILSL